MIRLLAIVAACALLGGCANLTTQRYSSSADNVVALRALSNNPVNVGTFASWKPGLKSIGCRGVGPVLTPDGETYADYIRKALTDELKLANAYSATSPITITGNLGSADFASMDGKWMFALTATSTNGKSVSVESMHKYPGNFGGDAACAATRDAFMPAVQDLIKKLVTSPDWPALAKQ